MWRHRSANMEDDDVSRQEARMLAAQAWCTPKTSSTEMDVELAEAFAFILEREVAARIA